jgi:MFS family permease
VLDKLVALANRSADGKGGAPFRDISVSAAAPGFPIRSEDLTATPAISRERFALLFAVMLVAAAGNTAMQSLMPAIGRQLGVPDIWVAVAFSLSAMIWVLTAPHWARRADHRGRRALMRLGLYGFIVSMLICGLVLAAGLRGWIGPASVFVIFVLGRAAYGGWGSASPPAVQAYVAARTDGEQRTNGLAAIASSFGLGTIIGPALAPLFVFPPLGLSGPLIVFAGIGALVLAAVALRLPDDTPRSSPRGQIVAYPAIGGVDRAGPTESAGKARPPLRWRDPRVLVWNVIGTVGGHGQAVLLGVIGFLVIDRLRLPLAEAQQWIGIVLMAGAGASLLAQWGLIPYLGLEPRQLIFWGALLASAGCAIIAIADGMYGTTLGFALASLGYGFFRPGFTSGASLAVRRSEQNIVAGMVTSVNGIAFIAAPAIGVLLYGIARPLPFLAVTLLMLGLAAWVGFRFRPSSA